MRITINKKNTSKKGEHIALISCKMSFNNDGPKYVAASRLNLFFDELKEDSHIEVNTYSWGKMDKHWDMFLDFTRKVKYKKDSIDVNYLMYTIEERYGPIVPYIEGLIKKLAKRVCIIQRAENCIHSAKNVSDNLVSEARKQAKEEINYQERIDAINQEMVAKASDILDYIIEDTKDEEWVYDNGKVIDPVVIELIRCEKENMKRFFMLSPLPMLVSNAIVSRGYSTNQYWLAAWIENSKKFALINID